jgi:hypothetical protein
MSVDDRQHDLVTEPSVSKGLVRQLKPRGHPPLSINALVVAGLANNGVDPVAGFGAQSSQGA